MLIWISEEVWCAEGAPAIEESHGYWRTSPLGTPIGRTLEDGEAAAAQVAAYNYRHPTQPRLELIEHQLAELEDE